VRSCWKSDVVAECVGDGGDGKLTVGKSRKVGSFERETCGETDSPATSGTTETSEGETDECARVTLVRLASSGSRGSGIVAISQNWKRGGYPSQCKPLVRHLSQMGRLRSHFRHFLRQVPHAGSKKAHSVSELKVLDSSLPANLSDER
jgi:hypothetical protein